MADITTIENMNSAVKSLRNLRHSFTAFFSFLSDGITGNSDEENEITRNKLMVDLQTNLK